MDGPADELSVPSDRVSADGKTLRIWARVREQIVRRHGFLVEIIIMVVLYAVYDSGRGLVVGGAGRAYRNARSIARLERDLHIFFEPRIQSALGHVPWLTGLFGVGYDSFHLGMTALALGWLYFRRPGVYARARTVLVVACLLALVGFALFPTAPPRLAGVGIKDTLHIGRTTAESGVLDWLYNPYAAIPSLHMAFAVVVGASLVLFARHRVSRWLGVAYPIFIAAEVLATGNHFILDVVTGVLTAVIALVITVTLAGEGPGRHLGPTLRLIAVRTGDLFRPTPASASALHEKTN